MIKFVVCFLLSLTVVMALNEALNEFATANNQFAASVYKEIVKTNNDNFLVSPYSAEAVLAFAQSGSRGKTGEELRKTLYLPDNNDKVELGVKASIPLLTGNQYYSLLTANKMYVKDGFTINEGFKKTAVDVYGADIESIDFSKKDEAVKEINQWVEDKTNNKIKNLVDASVMNPSLQVLLVNALYLKANWINPFKKSATKKDQFYKTSEDTAEVDMMHQTEEWYNYCESTELDAQFLELRFSGGDISMVIVLPNQTEGLKNLEDQVDKVLYPNFTREYLNIALPKFKIESTIPFIPILSDLGVSSAFDRNQADFSGIAGKPGDLVIGDVLQKTYIDVMEDGVEAAAATYQGLAGSAFLAEKPIPKDFIADHPFMFYIKVQQLIVFVGRVLAPNY